MIMDFMNGRFIMTIAFSCNFSDGLLGLLSDQRQKHILFLFYEWWSRPARGEVQGMMMMERKGFCRETEIWIEQGRR